MSSTLLPPLYAAFVWWFSTGAVLLLVGRAGGSLALKVVCTAGLAASGLYALAVTANDVSVGGAYAAFTGTILLWGAQEIAFLAGWVTGPRPLACRTGVKGIGRLGLALQAIAYHELVLLVCGSTVVLLTWSGASKVGLWTFAALWVLRQSAKINLFLGVPVTNDELMPEPVRFLKSYFRQKPVSGFFPLSVTLATAALVIMIQRLVEVAATPFEIAGLTLVSTLFALGVIEHWFMLLPLPAITLWGWGMRTPVSEETIMKPTLDSKPPAAMSQLMVISNDRPEPTPVPARSISARQRLEDEFRRRFLEQNPRSDSATTRHLDTAPAATINGRTS
ncbi:MAG: putative photosynthetic complex assembly protein PuhE [Tardiphaga sp.]